MKRITTLYSLNTLMLFFFGWYYISNEIKIYIESERIFTKTSNKNTMLFAKTNK